MHFVEMLISCPSTERSGRALNYSSPLCQRGEKERARERERKIVRDKERERERERARERKLGNCTLAATVAAIIHNFLHGLNNKLLLQWFP
jgi:hypothetical protein